MVIAFFIFLIFIFLTPNVIAADKVVINEFVSNPETGKEWVEFYNPNSFSVTLDGWILEEKTGSDLTGIKKHQISLLTVPAKGFEVFDFSKSSLNNNGDILTLKNGSGVVDQIAFGDVQDSKVSAPGKGKSAGRKPDGSNSWFIIDFPTKKSSNGVPPSNNVDTSTSQTGNIILTEFMPNPDEGKEWAEVYNPGSFEINISSWKIDDIEGASSPYTIPKGTKISAKSYKVFTFSSKLNNSGDSIRLLNPDGKIIETYSFKKTVKGVAFAKDTGGKWKATTTPTPGKTNKITGDSSSILTSGGGFEENNPEILESTGLKYTVDFIADSFQTDFPTSAPAGEVAGVSERKNSSNSLTTLLISAGIAFLGTAIVWPFLEKKGLV